MKKKILVINGGRGIGDLIYHLPLFRSLYKTYGQKITIFSNEINQSIQVFKNEKFYEEIIEFNNERCNFIKTIINIIKFRNKINRFNFDYIILTTNNSRLAIPVFLSNAKKKEIFGVGKFIINKDRSLDHLTVSEKIIKYTKNLRLSHQINNFYLNPIYIKKIKNIKKKIFISIDSHHDQNNWEIQNFIKIIQNLFKKNKIFINFSPNKKYLLKFFPEEIKFSKNVEFTHNKKIVDIIKILSLCDVVIGNESGPVCLGASLKKKVHAIFSPVHTRPESKVINKKNKYYNTHSQSSKMIIKKIIKSI